MRQSRKMRLIETLVNIVSSFVVSYLLTYFVLPVFGFAPPPGTAFVVTLIYTGTSFVRSYTVRSIFSELEWRFK